MSDGGAFILGAGIVLAGYLVMHGLGHVGDCLVKLGEALKGRRE